MRLCTANIPNIKPTPLLVMPGKNVAGLPEKVLQFGTGVLLRGLPDFIINNANNNNIFNGRIVVVKSTTTGTADDFNEQDCLYTLCVRGISEDKKVNQNHLVSSISRVISAAVEWEEILKCATSPDMQVIISNTTEVGLSLTDDDIQAIPPQSFPGKLLAFLCCRYKHFNGDAEKGMAIIPTELLPDNGNILLSIVVELAHRNNVGINCINWIQNANYFCSSLVDRIVPGKLKPAEQQQVENQVGFTDNLMIVAEPYYLWAIETDSEKVKTMLSFALNDNGVIIAPSINKFRELKLRLLNGAHTFSCGLAYLAGFTTVKEAMDNPRFYAYIHQLMYNEIIPSICSAEISEQDAVTFAGKVLDRFKNNFIEHKWISITMQYSLKMNTRNATVIQHYESLFTAVPVSMALGMAAHILFMKGEESTNDNYYGMLDGNNYWINDSNAAVYALAWKENNHQQVVEIILGNQNIWQTQQPFSIGFKTAVVHWLQILITAGASVAMVMADKNQEI